MLKSMNMIAAITGESLLNALLWLAIWGSVLWIAYWALGKIAPPEPFNRIAQIILVLAAAVLCINTLLGIGGHAFITWK